MTGLWAEGCSIAFGHALSGVRVDSPLGRGFLGLTALWAEGCGIVLSGDEFYCRLSAAGVTEFSCRSSVILSEAKDLGKNSK